MFPKKRRTNLYLSKSLFIRGRQCRKSLYLQKYHSELKDIIPDARLTLFEAGKEIGLVARKLFPGGVEIPFDNVPIADQLAKTTTEIKKGVKTLYEPAFSYNDVLVKIDILHKGKGGFELYEVKGATDAKEYYIDDIAIQYYVLKGLGVPVSKLYLVHINNQYVKHGEINVNELFIIKDMTDIIQKRMGFIGQEIIAQREILKGDMPEIDIGEYCFDPYECDYRGYCWRKVPEDSIFSLKGSGINPFELYRKGITLTEDIPIDRLPEDKRVLVEAATNKQMLINEENIRIFLNSIWYPLCFLDFETFQTAIPPFDGTRPYQHIPFQYSLHLLNAESSVLQHRDYIMAPGADSRKELLEKLLNEIPPHACVMAYYKQFEERILRNLAEWFPEYSERIDVIIKNMIDLAAPFKNKDFYHWQMRGSYSLKSVLPILIPELKYEGMAIADGEMAMNAYFTMCHSKDDSEIEDLRKSLLEYCNLDTLAMHSILNKLKDSI